MQQPLTLLLTLLLTVWSLLGIIFALDDPVLSPGLFYPFGSDVGDDVMVPNDDGSSGAVPTNIGFPFFATNNTELYVNTNGAISFGSAVTTYTPSSFPVVQRMLAPYWCDIDTTRNSGRIYFRQSNDETLLQRATTDVLKSFSRRGLHSFSAKWIFVATWHNVTYFGGGNSTPINSFQAVLITDGKHSIAIFNYGWMSWTTGTSSGGDELTGLGGTAAQVGFNAGDGVNFFAVPGSRQSSILQIAENTNSADPKAKGRWIFRIESSEIEAGNACERKGKCEAYQTFNSKTQECSAIAPAFGCPKLEGPVVIDRVWVEFYCDIPTEETRKDAVYDVTFLFNGQPNTKVPSVSIHPPIRKATLHEKDLHQLLGTWISCKVRSSWLNSATEEKSEELNSINSYYAGIEVSPPVISVHEGDENPVIVTVKSTIPITCPSEEEASRADKAPCGLTIRFRTSEKIVLLEDGASACTHTISEKDWKKGERRAYNVLQRIELYAKVDTSVSSPTYNTLAIDIAERGNKITSDGHGYKDIWHKHSLPTIQVYHNDGPHAVCRATGDPNLTTLDRIFYPIYASGQFTYVQTTRGTPIEIQVRHKPCGQVVSCACGVAAREGDVILVADRCVDPYANPVTPNDKNKLPVGTGIKVDGTGRSLEMRLPSNVRVVAYLMSWGMNIEIYLTPAEFDRTKGLCGTFDRNSSNDLWVKGHSRPTTTQHLAEFVESWRVPDNKSLFDSYLSNLNEGPTAARRKKRSYCSCLGVDSGDCGATKYIDNSFETNSGHNNDVLEETRNPVTNEIQRVRRRRSTDSVIEDTMSDDVDLRYDSSAYYSAVPKTAAVYRSGDTTWPSSEGGITETKARTHCRRVLWEKLPVRGDCEGRVSLSDVEGIVNKCVSDVKMTGNTSWADDKIQEMEGLCMFEVITANITERNETINDTKDAVRRMSDKICLPPGCSGHGTCRSGKCFCRKGYIGADCALSEDAEPKIIRLLSQSSCDVNRFLCQKVDFLTEDVAALSNLACKVEVKTPDDSTQPFDTTGSLKFLNVASCKLPTQEFQSGLRIIQRLTLSNETPTTTSTHELGFHSLPPGNPVLHYSISISNVGQRYSKPTMLTLYSSQCYEYDGTLYLRKNSTCLIRGYCFTEGERNPFNPECDLCDPTVSTNSWTKESHPSSCDPCRSSPCPGNVACISPFKGIYRCTDHSSRGKTILLVTLAVICVILLVFSVIIASWCRGRKVH